MKLRASESFIDAEAVGKNRNLETPASSELTRTANPLMSGSYTDAKNASTLGILRSMKGQNPARFPQICLKHLKPMTRKLLLNMAEILIF